jgi:hypothetical protein
LSSLLSLLLFCLTKFIINLLSLSKQLFRCLAVNMIMDVAFPSLIASTKGRADIYIRRITGHCQIVVRKWPQYSKPLPTSRYGLTHSGARLCVESWRMVDQSLTARTRILFSATSQTFFDWFREAYASFCYHNQTLAPVPFRLAVHANPAPHIFQIVCAADVPITIFLKLNAIAPITPYFYVITKRLGFWCYKLHRTKTYLTSYTQAIPVNPGAPTYFFLDDRDTDAFSFLEPTHTNPQLSFLPIVPNYLLIRVLQK